MGRSCPPSGFAAPGADTGRRGPRLGSALEMNFLRNYAHVLLGVELLRSSGADRRRALDRGVLIHASDTCSAALAGAGGQLPPAAARKAVAISAVNTVLALVARRPG
ncbi:MAG: hypothetical protein QOK04_1017 [Solirubrobacteraceae bacterium]|nr:hypothetical protein [Solirubrobacteraceae bacterium]